MFKLGLIIVVALFAANGKVREWKDASKRYTVKGDLIAFSSDQVIIKRDKSERLVAINISDLSSDDQAYLKSAESAASVKTYADRLQTWTFRGGFKVNGRVVNYAQRDIQILKKRGKIYVNDRPFENLPDIYQLIVKKIVMERDGGAIENVHDLAKWLEKKGGLRSFIAKE